MSLPAASELVAWAQSGGVETWLEHQTGTRPYLDASRVSSADDIIGLLLSSLENIDALLPPEPYVEDGEGIDEYAEWQKEVAELKESWTYSFSELALRIEEAQPGMSRDGELDALLAKYPNAPKVSTLKGMASYDAYTVEQDVSKAATLAQKVLDEALSKQYHMDGARATLDKLIAYRADVNASAPLEAIKTCSPRVRRIVHQMAEAMGLYTQSRDESGKARIFEEARREAWLTGKSGWKIKKTVLVSHVAFKGKSVKSAI